MQIPRTMSLDKRSRGRNPITSGLPTIHSARNLVRLQRTFAASERSTAVPSRSGRACGFFPHGRSKGDADQ
jgi:hypothetical protein